MEKAIKKLVLLIMLIMCTSSFSINAGSPHLLTSSNYRDCDDDEDDDHHDDEDEDDDDDDDDDHPALLINEYAYLLLIIGCIFIFKSINDEKE